MGATSELLRLAAGPVALDLVPGIGGSVAALRLGGVDLLRPLSEADRAAGNVLGTAMFPMVPYANRIAGNRFHFGGRDYRFRANNPPERFNVHGTGWHRPWQVKSVGPEWARLTLAVEAGEDPYRYHAWQEFAVDAGGVTVGIGVRNEGAETMPFGFGLHPWFPRDPGLRLAFRAARFYPEGPDHVALDPVPLPATLDFATPRALPDHWLNNDFGGWDGRAEMWFPATGRRISLTADPVFRHLMVYADPARPFFCVEPQSNAAGAFGRAGGFVDPAEGVTILEPGQEAGGRVRFDLG